MCDCDVMGIALDLSSAAAVSVSLRFRKDLLRWELGKLGTIFRIFYKDSCVWPTCTLSCAFLFISVVFGPFFEPLPCSVAWMASTIIQIVCTM